MRSQLLVVGAAVGSVGEAIADYAYKLRSVTTAGITGEAMYLNVMSDESIDAVFNEENWFNNIVCTVGINEHDRITGETSRADMEEHFSINVVGVIAVLDAWLRRRGTSGFLPGHFAAISSNSARIARRNSVAYCASKAALSMAIRCRAREVAMNGRIENIYCYEPGLMADTPMSRRVGGHRMPGVSPEGLNRFQFAEFVVNNLNMDGRALNGTCIAYDGGEQ